MSEELEARRRNARRAADVSWTGSPAAPQLRALFAGREADYQRLVERVARAAGTTLPALVEGEASPALPLVALAIHQTAGRDRPCRVVHAADTWREGDPDWIALGAEAASGSLLVTHVGTLSPAAQRGLLELLDRADAPRLLATTTHDLGTAGHVDGSLQQRLSVLRLRLNTPATPAADVAETLEDVERRVIAARLQAFGWQQQLTADSLGIDRKTLYRKIRRYGLERP